MRTNGAPSATQGEISEGTRGPGDDFFCNKYQVWYRMEDCVYRGRHKTFSGCVNCFQGYLNIRRLEKGRGAVSAAGPRAGEAASAPGGSTVVPFSLPDP